MENIPDYPSVSVVIPVCDGADGLRTLLPTILDQEYAGSLDILVADGSTNDKVSVLVRQYPMVRFVSNPERIVSTGINRALAVSTAEVVVRCDAHTRLRPDYIRRAVETLRRTGAANVGGQQCAVSESFLGGAIAIAQQITLGVGNSRHRIGGGEGPTDTVYLGIFRREALEAVGGFDPTLVRNQDYVVNWNLRQRGETVWFDPEIKVAYQPRQSIRELAKQYFDYGRWKRVVIRRYPTSIRPRHVATPLLTLGLGVSVVGAWAGVPLLLAFPFIYLLILVGEAVRVGVSRSTSAAVLLPLVLPIMHLAWGVGFFCPPRPIRKKGSAPTRPSFSAESTERTLKPSFPQHGGEGSVDLMIGKVSIGGKRSGVGSGTAGVAEADNEVSVVILTWNSVGKIEPCLESLGQSTQVPGEIIVVDNGSTDQTRAVLAARFPSVRVVENTTNMGVAWARNQGFAAARGAYVLMLDDDTIIQPETLARLTTLLYANPTVALCGPQLLDTSRRPVSIDLMFPTLWNKINRWTGGGRQSRSARINGTSGRMREVDYVIGACQLIRRAALDEVGLYDEHIFYGPEDIDFCLRLRQAGWRIVLQPDTQVIHSEQRIARSMFSLIGLKHAGGLVYYFWKHRYGLSRNKLSKQLPTLSPVSLSH